ncbi:MAG: CoB--CoM heterodisulfide reductase iron-sulfur subunit B family protein [Thermoplasmatota archaeon]
MKYALYLGCAITTEAYAYEMSARETLGRLGVEFVDSEGHTCCGITIRSINPFAFLYLAGRNIAICERTGLDIMTFCTGCRMTLLEAKHVLDHNEALKGRVNALLAPEGLEYMGTSSVKHIVELLHDAIGLERIKGSVVRTFRGLKVVSHYGCHALRPSAIGRQDDPENPQKLERLIEALGASSPDYPQKLDCCGAPLLLKNDSAAFTMAGQKIKAIQEAGIDAVVTVCPSCQKMLDTQDICSRTIGAELSLPVMYYTQLLGLAMGLDPDSLGLGMNISPVRKIVDWREP